MTLLAASSNLCRGMGRVLARWKRMRDGVPTGHEIYRLIETVGQ
ncbi:MAG TPA: hypothetical protein VGA51_00110 [Casimicrobiaceae bacterium]